MSLTETEIDPAIGRVAAMWLDEFAGTLLADPPGDMVGLFSSEATWRDVLAMTGDLRTLVGRDRIVEALMDVDNHERCRGFVPTLLGARRAEQFGRSFILVRFDFVTEIGSGSGIARLVDSGDDHAQAWTLLTALQRRNELPERNGQSRPTGTEYSRGFGPHNWLDQRVATASYLDSDPEVIVVGAGQAGLSIASRLVQLGIDTLVVDRHGRIGDNWRKRYHALTLHNVVWTNHLPYLPFPPSWPVYIPKDKLANWFEFYADSMELNVWTSTEFERAHFDEARSCWVVTLCGSDGAEIQLRPRHLVVAIGVSGIPNVPSLPGLEQFAGDVLHSSAYVDGEAFAQKRVLVVGTGNSGHDIAQDLYTSGAEVTMLQRSSTTVISLEPGSRLFYSLYQEESSVEESDLLTLSYTYPLMRLSAQSLTSEALKLDADLLTGLNAVGFRTDIGEDGTGWQFKYLRRGGGYYFNVGCSDLIAQGEIGVRQYADLVALTAGGATFKDGSSLAFDAVVLATGYQDMSHWIREHLGEDIAERAGPVWGFDDEGEMRNVWKRTRQRGLWFIMGSLAHARIFSRYLALQIATDERTPNLFSESDMTSFERL